MNVARVALNPSARLRCTDCLNLPLRAMLAQNRNTHFSCRQFKAFHLIGNRLQSSNLAYSRQQRYFSAHPGAEVDEESSAEDAPKCSPKVAKLVEEITLLNLVEVSQLVEQLKTTLNLPDTMGMPMAMPGAMPMVGGAQVASPAPSDAEEAEATPKEEEKPIVTVQLDSFDAEQKIKIIKEVKGISGLGLKEAKALVEALPAVVKADVKREEAQELAKTLEGLGAKVSLV